MIPSINVSELCERMKRENNLLLIDCREEDEYGQGHIKGSRLVPLSKLRHDPQSALPHLKEQKFSHCRSLPLG